MTAHAYDGTPITAGTEPEERDLTGHHPHFSILGLREMAVIDRKFIDDDNNRTRVQVEYVCRDMRTSEIITGVRRLSTLGGSVDGDDDVLKPAQALRPGTSGIKNDYTYANQTDGDVVLVGFVEGARQCGVILGVLRHSAATYGAKKADGERRLTIHKGTTIEIQQDGTYKLTGKGLVQFEGTNIKLGATATQHVIRAEDFNSNVLANISSAATALATTMATATTTLAPDVLSGVPTSATISTVTALIGALVTLSTSLKAAIAQFPSAVSSKVQTE